MIKILDKSEYNLLIPMMGKRVAEITGHNGVTSVHLEAMKDNGSLEIAGYFHEGVLFGTIGIVKLPDFHTNLTVAHEVLWLVKENAPTGSSLDLFEWFLKQAEGCQLIYAELPYDTDQRLASVFERSGLKRVSTKFMKVNIKKEKEALPWPS